MSKLNEKIQVLLSAEDLQIINRLIMREAFIDGSKPVPLSTYVRNIIKAYINDNEHLLEEQISFTQKKVKEEIDKIKNK